jgi:cytochrome c-type biogenesis protein
VNHLLESFSNLMLESAWFSPLLALLAGVITAFTPCCLSSVPLIIGYVGGTGQRDIKKSFKLSLTFSVGMVITSTILGVIVALLGTMVQMQYSGGWWYVVLGALMLLMALQVWEVITIIPSTFLLSKSTKKGHVGALIAGVLAGVFSSPCSTPILVALLTIVAQQGKIGWGAFLLFLYSVGHSVLFLFAGTFTGAMRNMMANKKYSVLSEVVKYVSGFAIMVLGLYMLYMGL